MRKIILILNVNLLFFAAVLCPANWGYAVELKWVYYGSATDGSLAGYYAPETIHCSSKGIVELWTKEVSNKKNVLDMTKEFGPKFKKLNYTLNHKRLDCSNKRLANLGMLYYSKKDVLIGRADIKKPRWKATVPGSMGEGLLNSVCGFCQKVPRQ